MWPPFSRLLPTVSDSARQESSPAHAHLPARLRDKQEVEERLRGVLRSRNVVLDFEQTNLAVVRGLTQDCGANCRQPQPKPLQPTAGAQLEGEEDDRIPLGQRDAVGTGSRPLWDRRRANETSEIVLRLCASRVWQAQDRSASTRAQFEASSAQEGTERSGIRVLVEQLIELCGERPSKKHPHFEH